MGVVLSPVGVAAAGSADGSGRTSVGEGSAWWSGGAGTASETGVRRVFLWLAVFVLVCGVVVTCFFDAVGGSGLGCVGVGCVWFCGFPKLQRMPAKNAKICE